MGTSFQMSSAYTCTGSKRQRSAERRTAGEEQPDVSAEQSEINSVTAARLMAQMQRSVRKTYSRQRGHCKCIRPWFCPCVRVYAGFFVQSVLGNLQPCSHLRMLAGSVVVRGWKGSRSCREPPPTGPCAFGPVGRKIGAVQEVPCSS